MTQKPLPKTLVQRLRRIVRNTHKKDGSLKRVYRALGRMQNIDHRHPERTQDIAPHDTKSWGGRVRKMNVSRNYPHTSLVLKRTHWRGAKPTITGLRRRVRIHNALATTAKAIGKIVSRHNRLFRPRAYRLLVPTAYAIGKDLVAMHHAEFVNVEEIVGLHNDPWDSIGTTERGRQLFLHMAEKGANIDTLRRICEQVYRRTGIQHMDLLITGFENNQFVLLPLIDYSKQPKK